MGGAVGGGLRRLLTRCQHVAVAQAMTSCVAISRGEGLRWRRVEAAVRHRCLRQRLAAAAGGGGPWQQLGTTARCVVHPPLCPYVSESCPHSKVFVNQKIKV